MKHIQLMIGLLAVAVCATLAGMMISPQAAVAGIEPTCGTATATPVEGVIAPFGISTDTPVPTATATAVGTPTDIPTATVTPIPTCTPVRRPRHDTPTATVTPEPSAPANTPVPAAPSATSPSGGAAGVGVQLPDTGSGRTGSAVNWLAFGGAAMLAAAGAGALAVGARRRR